MDKIIVTDDGSDILRVQLNDLPRRLMPRADWQRLMAKAVDEGVEIEIRNALGTTIIAGR
jgi:hypothetical protein